MRTWRTTELMLLPFGPALLAVGLATLAIVRRQGVVLGDVAPAVGLGVALLAAHLLLSRRYPRADQLLLPVAAVLSSVGLIMVDRLAPALALRQLAWVALGLGVMLATALLLPSVSWLRRYRYSAAVLGIALLVVTLVLGVDPNGSGARLWLGVPDLLFQPSEINKVLLVVFLAGYLEEKRELLGQLGWRIGPVRLPPLVYLGPLLVMWGLSLAVLVWQRDLGATLLFFGIFLAMLYMATARTSYVVAGLALLVLGAVFCYQAFAHVRVRVDVWLNPWSDPAESGYQLVQALMALASGGVLGAGLAHGYPLYIPAVHTDFAIAAIGEELGLAGSLAIVALYLVLVHRGYRIALQAVDGFSQLLAAGLTTVLGLQALVILAGTTRLIPVTGITLPFVSYGGSSLLTNFIIVGLLLRVSAEREGAGGG